MQSISISEFKATCLAVLERVRTTGQPIRVTRRGVAVAEIVPPGPVEGGGAWLGSLAGTAALTDDLIAPAVDPDAWDALR